MKTKIALTAIISILFISASPGLQPVQTEFQNQTEKLQKAIYEIVNISIAVVDYITDHGKAPDHVGKFDENSEFYKTICPYYLKTLPTKDPWGNDYLVFCGTSGNGQYGISGCEEDDVVVVCLGMDGKKEAWELDFAETGAGIFKVKGLDDFNKDLVCWSGSWIRAPEMVMDSN